MISTWRRKQKWKKRETHVHAHYKTFEWNLFSPRGEKIFPQSASEFFQIGVIAKKFNRNDANRDGVKELLQLLDRNMRSMVVGGILCFHCSFEARRVFEFFVLFFKFLQNYFYFFEARVVVNGFLASCVSLHDTMEDFFAIPGGVEIFRNWKRQQRHSVRLLVQHVETNEQIDVDGWICYSTQRYVLPKTTFLCIDIDDSLDLVCNNKPTAELKI